MPKVAGKFLSFLNFVFPIVDAASRTILLCVYPKSGNPAEKKESIVFNRIFFSAFLYALHIFRIQGRQNESERITILKNRENPVQTFLQRPLIKWENFFELIQFLNKIFRNNFTNLKNSK